MKRFERYLKTGSCTQESSQKSKNIKNGRKGLHLNSGELNYYRSNILTALLKAANRLGLNLPDNLSSSIIEIRECKYKSIGKDLSSNICQKFYWLDFSLQELAKNVVQFLPANWNACTSKNSFINFNRTYPTNRSKPIPSSTNSFSKQEMSIDIDDDEDTSKSHKLEITMEPSVFTQEKYDLYKLYQTVVHKSQESSFELLPTGFRDFLCNTPLIVC